MRQIFPADAGVNLANKRPPVHILDIPRGCGGEPIGLMLLDPVKVYSPRMRG